MSFVNNGFTYTYTLNVSNMTITAISPTTGNIVIPSTYSTYTTTRITASITNYFTCILPKTLTSLPSFTGTYKSPYVDTSWWTQAIVGSTFLPNFDGSRMIALIIPNFIVYIGSSFLQDNLCKMITFPPNAVIAGNNGNGCSLLEYLVFPLNSKIGGTGFAYAILSGGIAALPKYKATIVYDTSTNFYYTYNLSVNSSFLKTLNATSGIVPLAPYFNGNITLAYKVPFLPTYSNGYNISTINTNGTILDPAGAKTYTDVSGRDYTNEMLKHFITRYAENLYGNNLSVSATLPGYENTGKTALSNINIYNASKNIPVNYINTLSSSTLLNTSFYVHLDQPGDNVTLYTPSNTAVLVTKTGSYSYTINYNSSTYIGNLLIAPYTLSLEGLWFTLGSVFGQSYIPPVPPLYYVNNYYHTFYTCSSTRPTVLTRTIYDNSMTLQNTLDISFGGQNIRTVLSLLDSSGSYTLGLVDVGGNSVAMDVAYCGVYSKALTTTQQQKLMTYVNTTFKEPRTAATTFYTVTVSGGVFWLAANNGSAVPRPSITFTSGLYVFDQSDPTNTGNTLVLGTTLDVSSSIVGNNVIYSGTAGKLGAYTLIDFSGSNPAPLNLYYFSSTKTGLGPVVLLASNIDISKPTGSSFLNGAWTGIGTGATTNTITIAGSNYYNGTYTATASSVTSYPTFGPATVFQNYASSTTYSYNSGPSLYNTSTGSYTGSISTTYNTSSTLLGEWLQIQLPYKLQLKKFSFVPRDHYGAHLPVVFGILGSTDGSNWTLIHYTNSTYAALYSSLAVNGVYNTLAITFTSTNQGNTSNFSYFRLVFNKLGTSLADGAIRFCQWNLFGDFYSE